MRITKAIATIEAATDDDSPNGSFEAILSAPTLDRDGDTFATDEWKTPLPDHITIDIDHGMSVESTVGSAVPAIDDDGNLRIRGTYASTPKAQELRALVNEGHIRTMSVACLTQKSTKDQSSSRELLNGAFVAVPSNRESVILSSKAFDVMEKAAADATSAADARAGAPRHDDMVQAIHDASHALGADCVVPGDDPASGASEGANKSIGEQFTDTVIAALGSPMVVGKAVAGSLEDLQSAIGSALDDAYADAGSSWSYLVATFIDPAGDAGTAVYRLYTDDYDSSRTLSRTFTVDPDGRVTLGTEVAPVELVTTTTIAEKAAAHGAALAADGRIVVRNTSGEPERVDSAAFTARLDELVAPKTSDAAGAGTSPTPSPDEPASDDPAATPESAPSPDDRADADVPAESGDDDTSADEKAAALLARSIQSRIAATQFTETTSEKEQ